MICKATISLVLLSLPVAADEARTPVAADFSPGFQRLAALGLPSLEGAQWVAAGEDSREIEYELRKIFEDVKGNGWKIQLDGKPAFVPLGTLDTQEMPAEQSGGGLLGGLFGGGSKKVKALDLVKDATKLTAYLDDPQKSKDFREGLEYRGSSSLGTLLIFATQIHQSGHPAEAGHLAATVFSLGVSPEEVIDAAVNRIASRDHKRVTEAFFSSHDWAAYERELRALVERYPRGWESFPAVQILLPAVAKRVAGEVPAKPQIAGVTLRPEAITALDAALQETKSPTADDAVNRYAKEHGIPAKSLTPDLRRQIAHMLASGHGDDSSEGPWLIEEPPDAESKDPWSQLKRLGLDALPALAAVANDETLTFSRNASSYRSSYSSSRESAAEKALQAYRSLDRPLARGELSCRLLAATLPGENLEEADPETLAATAMEFWKSHRGKPKLDLLLAFLTEGDSSQKSIASTTLAEMPDPAAHQAFEKHVLESGELTESLDPVATYLKLRKSAAKEFFTRFSTALKAQLDGVDLDEISGGYDIKRAGGVDKYLKKLSLLVGGASPRKLVLELAKAEKPDKQQIGSLAETLMESSQDEFTSIYLEAAAKATHLATRAEFLSMLSRLGNMRYARAEEQPPDSPVPPAQVEHWTTLLADDRLLPDGLAISHHAADAIEQLHSPASAQQARTIYQIDPAGYPELVLARARDRIAGKTPTSLPDAAKVSASRLEELLKQLADAKPEKVHDLTQAWTIEEKLAFQKWRSDLKHAAKIPASVIAARKLLTAPVESIGGPFVAQQKEILQSLDLKPGTTIDYDLVTNLAGTLALAAKKHSALAATFASSPLDTGFVFQAVRTPAKNNGFGSNALQWVRAALQNSDDDAVVGIGWIVDRDWVQAIWKLEGGTVTPPEQEILEKLRESMASRDQPEEQRFDFAISVLHRDDLEKLNTLNKLNRSSEGEDSESPDE